MMKKAIYLRMCLVAICAVLFTFAATFATGLYTFRVQMGRNLEIQANSFAAGYDHAPDKQAFLESLPYTKPLRITVILANGVVAFDNYVDSSTMGNHNERPEVMEARKNGAAEQVRFSSTLGKQTLYYAVKVQDESVIRLAHTTSIVSSMLKQMWPYMLSLIFVILLLTIYVANRLTRKIVAPINRLDLDDPLENEIYEELTPLLTKIHKQKIQIKTQLEILNKNKKEFNVIIENMAEGMVLLDCQMNIISTNRSAVTLLKAKHQDYTGRNLIMLSRNKDIYEMVEKALRGSNSNRLINTGSAYLELLANPVETKGKIIGCVLLILDISDKYLAEQSRKEFTANVSHELKTPLTSIYGYAEMLLLGMAKDKDIKHFAGKIHSESRHLMNLVDDILELSKLDEKDELKASQAINLGLLCERVIERLALPAQEKNISFVLEGGDVYITGDYQMLEELVYNLCDNAVKYNNANGKVKISIEKKNDQVWLKVADTGIGIAQSELPRIFERFYRVDKSRTKEVRGTGLGLSIVKHVAKYHDADIDVTSQPGEGTQFTVKFNI